MALVYANTSGNWSNPAIWSSGGAAYNNVPQPGDLVYSNNRIVNIDTNTNVSSISNLASGGAAAGGYFIFTNNVIITAGEIEGRSTPVLYNTGNTVTIFGSISSGNVPTDTGVMELTNNSITYFIGDVYVHSKFIQTPSNFNNSTIILKNTATLHHRGFIYQNGPYGAQNVGTFGIRLLNSSTLFSQCTCIGTSQLQNRHLILSENTSTCNLTGIFTMLSNRGTFGYTLLQVTGNSTMNILATQWIQSAGFCGVNSGTLNLTGTIFPNSYDGSIYTWSGGTSLAPIRINLFGDQYGSRAATGFGGALLLENNFTQATVYGNLIGGIVGGAVTMNNANTNLQGTTLTVYGNVSGDVGSQFSTFAYGAGVYIQTPGTVNIYGNLHGSNISSIGVGVANIGGTVNVYGNVYGGSLGQGIICRPGVSNNIYGTARGGNVTAINYHDNNSNCTTYVKKIAGGPGGPTAPGGSAPGVNNGQLGIVFAEELEYGAQGASPVNGPVFILNRPNTTILMEGPPPSYTSTSFFGNLNVPGLFPPVSSVRLGITYGSGDFTGTMAIPPKEAVQVGVPVDNTFGTFVLSPESFWTIKRSNSALNDPSTIGYRIKNLATTSSVGTLMGSYNLSGYPGQY